MLHDVISGNAGYSAAQVTIAASLGTEISGALQQQPHEGIEITVKPDPKLFDGRFSNINWLQELPDPMTKVTWDNVVLMSPATAEASGIDANRNIRRIN